MKTYLYSIETGIYLGEDFSDQCFCKDEQQELPPGCTTVAPPEYGKGEVPVFDVVHNRWMLSTLSIEAEKTGIVLSHAPADGIGAAS